MKTLSARGAALNLVLAAAALAAVLGGVLIGETALTAAQLGQGVAAPASPYGEILWQVRAPRTVCALMVGAALGLAGAVMQGLLRNPLAEPGVLGVSAVGGLFAATAIVLGMAAVPGAVETAALAGAALAGLMLVGLAARVRAPEALILFGVALSAFAGALTALIFNLSPSPIAASEIMSWLLGSVQNRSWIDVLWIAPGLVLALVLARIAAPGLKMLTLGDEAASASGLDMRRLRLTAIVAACAAAGAAVAVAGVIGFVGLAAPHMVRPLLRGDPGRLGLSSALAGGVMLALADILARVTPTEQELKLGVFTALIGAPLFALIAWRSAREWRA